MLQSSSQFACPKMLVRLVHDQIVQPKKPCPTVNFMACSDQPSDLNLACSDQPSA